MLFTDFKCIIFMHFGFVFPPHQFPAYQEWSFPVLFNMSCHHICFLARLVWNTNHTLWNSTKVRVYLCVYVFSCRSPWWYRVGGSLSHLPRPCIQNGTRVIRQTHVGWTLNASIASILYLLCIPPWCQMTSTRDTTCSMEKQPFFKATRQVLSW